MHVLLMPGTYSFDEPMCSYYAAGSALCINRTIKLEAFQPGSSVLDAQGASTGAAYLAAYRAGNCDVASASYDAAVCTSFGLRLINVALKQGARVELSGLVLTGGFSDVGAAVNCEHEQVQAAE